MRTRMEPISQSGNRHSGCHVHVSPGGCVCRGKSFDRTLTVNGPVTLHVSTGSGYIHVSPGSDSQVHIVGHVKSSNSWWGGSSDDAVSKVASNPPINQAGNIIRVGETAAMTSCAMSRSITRSRPRPIPCLWPRAVPATCNSPI